jgi:L-cysteine S-thiosulfotransferase
MSRSEHDNVLCASVRAATFAAMCACVSVTIAQAADAAYRVVDDAIPEPLAAAGDATRGRRLALDRNGGACVLCHALPETSARFMGTVGPSLNDVGSRYTAGQLRLRIVAGTLLKADAVMPAYYRSEGLNQVATPYRGRTILTAQQVEDVVAYLGTLR